MTVSSVSLLRTALGAIQDEPELPGPMPDEVWYLLRGADRETTAEFLRALVRDTKKGIATRLMEKLK